MPPAALVRLRDVTKTYRRGGSPVHALRDVSLSIPAGTFAGVVGPSGSGKSTLLHLMAALDQPTAGTIRVGDWALGTMDDAARARYRRSMVGLVFQEFHLVPTMTARENVALPLLLADEPTGNLDAATGDRIIDLLARLRHEQNRTVVVVTHHFGQIEAAAEQVFRLRDGALRNAG